MPGEPGVDTRAAVHLVGCCGSGMKGLAELLLGWGYRLSGSDASAATPGIQRLIERGFRFQQGHAADAVPAGTELVVYSQAIADDNPERFAAAQREIPQLPYSRMLSKLTSGRSAVCIAGTHGKSTTTALTGWLLDAAGCAPSALFGAELCGTHASTWSGAGEHFVVESCEFRQSFLDFQPHCAAILSVEADHFDCYADLAETTAAFGAFAARVASDGWLLIRQEDAAAQLAARQAAAPVLTFGLTSEADWWAADLRPNLGHASSHEPRIEHQPGGVGTRCRLFRRGRFITELEIPLPGRHNVMNVLAAAAMAYELGVTAKQLREGVAEFPGIRRRFERLGSWRGVTLIDDYAHHPTAVQAVLQTAREQFPGRRLKVAFQPHQVSRTSALLAEFVASLKLADELFLLPVFAARETVTTEPRAVSERLADGLRAQGRPVRVCVSLDHLQQVVEDALLPGDLFLTLGAGDIDRMHYGFTRRFFRDPAA